MKKNVKWILSFVMAMAVMLTCQLFLDSAKVSAAGYELEEDTTYELTLVGNTTDTYTYTMPKNGYFYVEVTPTYYTKEGEDTPEDSFSTWWMPFRVVANYKEYEKVNCYKSDGTYVSKMYCFTPGTEVQLEFSSHQSGYLWHYNVAVFYVEEDNFESESNNSKKIADSVNANKTYSGILNNDDTDWYVFKAPAAGKYKVYFTNTDTNSGNSYMTATVYSSKSKVLADTRITAGTGVNKCCTVKLKKGEKLYLKTSNPYGNFVYNLKIKK